MRSRMRASSRARPSISARSDCPSRIMRRTSEACHSAAASNSSRRRAAVGDPFSCRALALLLPLLPDLRRGTTRASEGDVLPTTPTGDTRRSPFPSVLPPPLLAVPGRTSSRDAD
eukprot:CAMPEP_0180342324 /NCGR_PEP_ID=MMETSP0989-20121125/1685_1 /TAXON_ID=697907 /ORGANISM="non described non described, Strain CCMP2293" /LENGTH=114 /DNA_ID=CAMNT_0022331193 /DNA_START=205 /DNA_END=546 /DNA_ORIENTATION=+